MTRGPDNNLGFVKSAIIAGGAFASTFLGAARYVPALPEASARVISVATTAALTTALLGSCSAKGEPTPDFVPLQSRLDPTQPEKFPEIIEGSILDDDYAFQAETTIRGINFRFYSDGDIDITPENVHDIVQIPFQLIQRIPNNEFTAEYGPILMQALSYDFTGTTVNVIVSQNPNTCVVDSNSVLPRQLATLENPADENNLCGTTGAATLSVGTGNNAEGLAFPIRNFVVFVSTNGDHMFYGKYQLSPEEAIVSNFLHEFIHQLFRAMGVQQIRSGNDREEEFVQFMEFLWLEAFKQGKLKLPVLVEY